MKRLAVTGFLIGVALVMARTAFAADAPAPAALTPQQLDDADLVDAAGRELGEVEAVLLDDSGAPRAVVVELDDDVFAAERLVEIALDDLTAQPARKYLNVWSDRFDLVTDQPLSWFETAPDWRPTRAR